MRWRRRVRTGSPHLDRVRPGPPGSPRPRRRRRQPARRAAAAAPSPPPGCRCRGSGAAREAVARAARAAAVPASAAAKPAGELWDGAARAGTGGSPGCAQPADATEGSVPSVAYETGGTVPPVSAVWTVVSVPGVRRPPPVGPRGRAGRRRGSRRCGRRRERKARSPRRLPRARGSPPLTRAAPGGSRTGPRSGP
jgi:hypothetical protein